MSDKLKQLRAMADKVEPYSYMRGFSVEELEEMKTQFLNKSFQLRSIEDEFADVKEGFKEKMKPIKKDINELMANLKDKAESVTEDCFVEFDHERKVANYYSPSTGAIVYTRPLTASEMQPKLNFQKTGTED